MPQRFSKRIEGAEVGLQHRLVDGQAFVLGRLQLAHRLGHRAGYMGFVAGSLLQRGSAFFRAG